MCVLCYSTHTNTKEHTMDEAKIERLERAIWEITQLAQELEDMGYGTFAADIDNIVANIEIDIEAAVEGMDNVA